MKRLLLVFTLILVVGSLKAQEVTLDPEPGILTYIPDRITIKLSRPVSYGNFYMELRKDPMNDMTNYNKYVFIMEDMISPNKLEYVIEFTDEMKETIRIFKYIRIKFLFDEYIYTIEEENALTYEVSPSPDELLYTIPSQFVFTFSDAVTIGSAYVKIASYQTYYLTPEIISETEVAVSIPETYISLLRETFELHLYDENEKMLALAVYTQFVAPSFTVTPSSDGQLKELPEEITFTFSAEVEATKAIVTYGSGSADIPYDLTDDQISVPIQEYHADILENEAFTVDLYGIMDTHLASVSYEVYVPHNNLILQKSVPENNSSVGSLETITLTFGTDEIGISGIDEEKKTVQLMKEDGSAAAIGILTVNDNGFDIHVTLDHAIDEAGTYTLTIPEATVYDDQAAIRDWNNLYVDVEKEVSKKAEHNPECVLTYTIDPASAIHPIYAMPTGEIAIYSIQGVLLHKGEPSYILKDLSPGIYIVNGRKMPIGK